MISATALSPAALLELWERAIPRTPLERALLLLAAAYPGHSLESLADLSIGRRDALLIALREALFGPSLDCFTTCPVCGERLELVVDAAELLAAGAGPPQAEPLRVPIGELEVDVRLPSSHDLLRLPDGSDEQRARALFERCVVEMRRAGEPIAPSALPDEILAIVVARMSEADPLADVQLALACPACGNDWLETFDIVGYLWRELNAWANRTLRDVHSLASSYGWGEAEILAMPSIRRQRYLEMIGG